MAKRKSTPDPTLASLRKLIDWANHRLGIAKSDEQAHQYAPVQKPRRCVWEMHPTMGRIEYTGCGSGELVEGGYLYKFCPYCGGRIVRRKS